VPEETDLSNTRKDRGRKSRPVAVLLSAFACPGAGQIYKGHRLRGGLLIGLSLLIVTVAMTKFMLVMSGITVNMAPGEILGDIPGVMYRALLEDAVFFKGAMYGFLAVWTYSVVDALAARPS